MRYTKKNLRTVEDSAVKFGLSTSQEARFPREELGAEQTGMNLLRVKPGQRAVRVSPGVARSFEAAEEGLEVLIVGPHVEDDGELVPDFWE
jgi:hypothetical protein